MNEEQRQRAIELIDEDLDYVYACGANQKTPPSDTAETILDGVLGMIEENTHG